MAERAEKDVQVGQITYHTTYEAPSTSSEATPLVVLIHALMADLTMYDSLTNTLLKNNYRVLRYDHIGHGRSPRPDPSLLTGSLYTFDDMTRDIPAIIRAHTASSPFALIGCSMGGVIAIRYALLYPGSARAIIAMGAPGLTALEAAKPLWTERIMQFDKDRKDGKDTLARATAERWLPGDEERSVYARAKALEMTKRCSFEGYCVCADAIRDYDYLDQLGKIDGNKTKVMVLAGSRDHAVGPKEVLEDVARRIDKSEYVWLDGAGHLPPLHMPADFKRIALEFLDKAKR